MQVPLIGNLLAGTIQRRGFWEMHCKEWDKDDATLTTYNPSQLAKKVTWYAVYKKMHLKEF